MHRSAHQHDSAHPLVTLAIDERHGRTFAKVELEWGSSHLAGIGVAYRHPSDNWPRESGQGLATARALADLAEQVTALSAASN